MVANTAQKMKFFIKHVFSKCDQIRRKLWMWPHLLKKFLMENFIFCVAKGVENLWNHSFSTFAKIFRKFSISYPPIRRRVSVSNGNKC